MTAFDRSGERETGLFARRRIVLIVTGGTIDSLGRDRLDIAWYADHNTRLDAGEMLARLPEVAEVAHVHEVPFRRLPSQALTDTDWLDLLALIHSEFLTTTADGFVVTHGTNTLEETAFFLHLTAKTDRPIVLVGAMRPVSALSSDGDLNLLNAIAAAASGDSVGKGVLVVLNDTIFSARDVTKASTYRVSSFSGRDTGPLGFVDGGQFVTFYHASLRPHTTTTEFSVEGLAELPRVALVTSYVGADRTAVDAFVASGCDGLVVAGSGAGRLTPSEEAGVIDAVNQGVSVCVASRVGSGRVAQSPTLKARGIVAADNLVPWKARILLSLGLTVSRDPNDLQRFFDTY